MANEAVIIELINGGESIRFTCADGTAISKGALLHLKDPRTVIASSKIGEQFAGIAAADKQANDGATTIACHTKGIFDLYYGGGSSVSAGDYVVISGANSVVLAETSSALSGGMIVGKALEDATAGTAETIAVLVGAR